MKKVSTSKVITALAASESPLPAQIQEALGELVGAAREGLLALSVGVGLGVVHELLELEVTEVVGPKGKRSPDRTAKRHGHEDGSMTLGGRRVGVRRPRIRTANDAHELAVRSYECFADRDPVGCGNSVGVVGAGFAPSAVGSVAPRLWRPLCLFHRSTSSSAGCWRFWYCSRGAIVRRSSRSSCCVTSWRSSAAKGVGRGSSRATGWCSRRSAKLCRAGAGACSRCGRGRCCVGTGGSSLAAGRI